MAASARRRRPTVLGLEKSGRAGHCRAAWVTELTPAERQIACKTSPRIKFFEKVEA
jgi:hypothetical protein